MVERRQVGMRAIVWCLAVLVCVAVSACAQKAPEQRYTERMEGYQRRMEKLQAKIEQEQKREMERVRKTRGQKNH